VIADSIPSSVARRRAACGCAHGTQVNLHTAVHRTSRRTLATEAAEEVGHVCMMDVFRCARMTPENVETSGS
jgi:hypothetical protein